MRGGTMLWTSALLIAGSGLQASAGPTSYSGPLPRLVAEAPDRDLPGPFAGFLTAADGGAPRPGLALDLAAAGKLEGLPSRGCSVEETEGRLHLATAAAPG